MSISQSPPAHLRIERRKFLAGLIAGIVLTVAAPLTFLATGSLNVAATARPGRLEKTLAPWALGRSVRRRAPGKIPRTDPNDPVARQVGLLLYRDNCVMCHGAPGVEVAELARGLNPDAPMLDAPDIQRKSDGELFWVVKNGIRLTGMPAFGPGHRDEEIARLIALLRRLDRLSPQERAVLGERAGGSASRGARR